MTRASGLRALLALAVAGCAPASADGGPPAGALFARLRVQPPDNWKALPDVAKAAQAAAVKAAKTAATEIEAWGDPAAGCYAIAVESRGTAKEGVAASADRLRAALVPLGAAVLPQPVKDIVDAEVPIAGAGLTGTARVRLYRAPKGTPQGVALVCAWSSREPARCKTLCQALQLQLAPVPAVAP